MGRYLKGLGRLNNVAVRYSATYAADASMNSVYIDMSIPGLPNVSQVMSDVMYDVVMARAKEWVRNDLPTVSQPAMPFRHNFSTGIRINARITVGMTTVSMKYSQGG
jgi:hypothetical protein